MKYLLSESQMSSVIQKYLYDKMVKDSGIICKIIVNNAEDDDDKKIKFDIYIVLSGEWFTGAKISGYGFKLGAEKRLKKYIKYIRYVIK